MPTTEPTLPGLGGAETARILLASDIRNLVRSHGMLAPFDEGNVASCTYDLTAGSKALLVGVDQATEHPIRPDHSLRLEPGAYAGIISREKVTIPPNVFVLLGPKRRLSYEGIILLSGSVIHPGYEGHCLFVLFNSSGSPRVITFGRKICAAVFHQLDRPVPREELQGQDRQLLVGNFPDEFQNAMANIKLPSLIEVNKRLEAMGLLETRIRELERDNKDVREPIKRLVESVQQVNEQVKSLANEGKEVLAKIREHEGRLTDIKSTLSKHGAWIAMWSVVLGLVITLLIFMIKAVLDSRPASAPAPVQVAPASPAPSAPASASPAPGPATPPGTTAPK